MCRDDCRDPVPLMWVKLRTTEAQRDAWYAKAEAKGVTFSELARQTLDGLEVRRRKQLRRVDPDLLRQLARIGNNLNQLTRRANRDQCQTDATALIAHLMEIDRELAWLRQSHEVRDVD